MLTSLHGVRRDCSPASSVLLSTPTSCRPSRIASLPSLSGTARARLVCSPRAGARRPRAWGFHAGPPSGSASGDGKISQVPGEPLAACPALRPRRDLCVRPLLRFGVAFRSVYSVGSRDKHLSGLHHTAHPLAVYASQDGSPRHHARLASGCLASFTGRAWLPAGFLRKVSVHSSSWPRLDLAQTQSCSMVYAKLMRDPRDRSSVLTQPVGCSGRAPCRALLATLCIHPRERLKEPAAGPGPQAYSSVTSMARCFAYPSRPVNAITTSE